MQTIILFLLTLAWVCPVFSQVVLNEILFDPPGSDTGEERIELRNAGGTSIDIGGYHLSPDGNGYFTFPPLLLAPGDIVVVHLRETGVDSNTDVYHSSPTQNMGNSSGFAALFNSTTHGTANLISYVQWGIGSQSWAATAVTASVWTVETDPVPAVSEGHSIEYDGSGYSPDDWFDQANPTVGSSNVLPIELVSFFGTRVGDGVVLSWETASEIDNLGFEIERKEGRSEWKKIGFIPGSGTSQMQRSYSFKDLEAGEDQILYRIKQLDRAGGTSYSDTVIVAGRDSGFLFECYPNPFNPSARVQFASSEAGEVAVRVFDLSGRMVRALYSGPVNAKRIYSVEFNGESLASGMYIAQYAMSGKVVSRRMILLK